MADEEAQTNGETGLDLLQARQVLLANSAKQRVAELNDIHERLTRQDIPLAQILPFLNILFDTYPLYVDDRSRHAVESCLTTIASLPTASAHTTKFAEVLEKESTKVGIAPGNAFVLIRWSSLLIQVSAEKKEFWESWGARSISTLSNASVILYSSEPKDSTRSTALRVSRRAFRTLVKAPFGAEAIGDVIESLTKKAAGPCPRNAIPLGIIAGVCSRVSGKAAVVEDKKSDYIAFYLREILGSRTPLPAHIADGLKDFFASYVSVADLSQEIIPSVEKALLRSPEIVLNDLVSPLFAALPDSVDLSGILANNLLKPLLANTKSSNASTREGAVRTFRLLATRSYDDALIEKAADEILGPLKGNKITAADQRLLQAEMLSAFKPSAPLATKILQGLNALSLKETNEPAASALLSTLGTYLQYALQNDVKVEAATIDTFAKGVADKRAPMRRIWALQFAECLWQLKEKDLSNGSLASITDACTGKLVESFNDAVANPIPALQAGQVPIACATSALCISRLASIPDLKNSAAIKKAGLLEKALTIEPKPSFLLNPRIYTKLTSADDLTWLLRALTSTFPGLPKDSKAASSVAWAQAMIFLLVSSSVPPKVRREATTALSLLYHASRSQVSSVVIAGLWQWCEDVELEAKESAALASKTGREELYKVIRAICSDPPSEATPAVDPQSLEEQYRSLHILCRSQLIPKAPWIELARRIWNDLSVIVKTGAQDYLSRIIFVTENPAWKELSSFHDAAHAAAAELVFVAPSIMTPLVVAQITSDLDAKQLDDIGPTEAAIYRTPEGTAFIDVLSKQSQTQQISKTDKDYDLLKWEEELRAQIAQKKGQAKKLTPEEQSKVKAQLAKEAAIRQQVAELEARLRRGIGIIVCLTKGPVIEGGDGPWFGPSVKLLFDVVEAGAGLILGNAPALGYLKCSEKTDSILGSLRPFVGVATLRAAGITILPENLLAEPLGDLITRVMYRLRFLGERKPFDPVTLSYILALVFLILESGGIDREASEEADEQIVLAIEFLSFHTRTCTDTKLPRQKLFTTLIASMQRYTQHFRPCRDCFSDLCENISENINEVETDTVVKGSIVPDISVRNAVLQAISDHLFLSDREFYEEIWLASHDDDEQNASIAQEIWAEHKLVIVKSAAIQCLPYLQSKDSQLRRAAARAVAAAVQQHPETFTEVRLKLEENYVEFARARKQRLDRYGMPIKQDLADPWEARHGFALAFKELAPIFPSEQLIEFMGFLVEKGPLSDKSTSVRDAMVDAATTIVALRGMTQVEPLMKSYETTLQASSSSQQAQEDLVNEAVVILYGALARHLPKGDARMAKVVNRLLSTLSTPSESVQYAVAMCLPPLVKASSDQANEYLQQMVEEMLHAKKYAARRGAAYGLAGIVKGKGISLLKDSRLLSTLRSAADNKKDPNERQGAFLAFELLSLMLVRIFEPYVIQIVPQLLAGFADTSADVRMACLDAAKTCFSSLSSYGVKQVLPILLEGLDDQQWRSKKGACDSLGAMAYLDPQQLAISLPAIIPPLTEVLNDSHKEVRGSANKSLQRFGEVISNPEVKSQVGIVLKALSDPTKYTDDALDALIKVNFIHYLDAPSLALVVRILERGLGDRSATKRKAAQIIGSLAHLTERKDLIAHLPILVAGLRVAIVDPVPTTRATASKALGSTIEKLGEDALPDLIPSLMSTLKSDTGAGDRLGSAQALSEVLAGLGTGRLEETLPTILQNVSSSKASVREGFMSLFIFLPACFGNSFANYLSKIIPPILSGLADDVESIRETALRAGRLLVKNFAARSVDLLLPELERGLADDNYRIRLSSVELVGDLLFNLTGISGKAEAEDMEEGANEAGQSLLEVIGEEKRNRVLSALYICRCDTSGLVRTSALGVWKALVSSPRTLRELIPTLTQLLIRRLASSNMEQKVIAGNALGELIRKAGEGVLATLLPTLEEGLQTSTDTDARQGICIALRELITSAAPEALEDYEKTLMSVVRTALVDSDEDVREEAAEAFDSLQKIFGKRAVDQVLPYLLSLLRSEDDAEHALSALLTLLTDSTRSNIILPNLLPTLIAKPITAFNARALASLAEVASSSMTRRLNVIINALIDGALETKDESLHTELTTAVDTIILSVDEYDGLNTLMTGVMLPLAKHDDHRKREIADLHLAKFFEATEVDFSRYYPDLIRALLIAFDDSAAEVVKAAWTAMNALTQQLRKEEMESLVTTTRTTLNQVGVAGHNLPGFSLPKGINAILPIFLQGLMNGSAEQRTQAALAISDLIDRTSPEGLKPFVTQITGPLIRVVSERSTDLKAAILLTLNNLLEKIPTFLKPFLPQLQRTFAKSLADPTSEVLRSRAAKALGTLITMTPRVDPLIAELVTGSKTTDSGVRTAMLKALYEVVSKAGANMNEVSRNSILGLIDSESGEGDDALNITFAKLLGALIKVLPAEPAASLIKSRVLLNTSSNSSVLALNAVLAEAPEALIDPFEEQTRTVIAQGINSNQPFIADNSILAAGKYLLTESSDKSYAPTKPILEALAGTLPVGKPVDARRLTLVVLRTVSREHNDLIRSHLPTLVQPVFRCVRDPVIPIKLSAEAAFLAMFSVVEEESAVFDNYMSGPGASLPPAEKRSMQEYFKRIALRLSSQARERKEAEGGQGGLGLSSDEVDDEREVWSIGRVDLGEGAFGDD